MKTHKSKIKPAAKPSLKPGFSPRPKALLRRQPASITMEDPSPSLSPEPETPSPSPGQ